MTSSQMSLLLLTLLTLTTSTSAIPTIYDILNQFGFPSGILPDSVTSYTTLPADDGVSFNFIIILNKPCYVNYDRLVSFDSLITGTITYGEITNLKGLKTKSLWSWSVVDGIKVDGNNIHFSQGYFFSISDITFYVQIPTCKDNALAACGQSSNLISQLPMIAK